MSKLNVFVAPTIHGSVQTVSMQHLTGGDPRKTFSQGGHLESGKVASEFGLVNPNKGVLGSLFTMALNKGRVTDIDLSVKAPVSGQYFGRGDFFGLIRGDVRNRYDNATAIEDNQPPQTLDQLTDGNYQSAFFALTKSSAKPSARAIYNDFFENLRTNRDLISGMIENLQGKTSMQSVEEFWQAIDAEFERLSKIRCPSIPYDGRKLGL